MRRKKASAGEGRCFEREVLKKKEKSYCRRLFLHHKTYACFMVFSAIEKWCEELLKFASAHPHSRSERVA